MKLSRLLLVLAGVLALTGCAKKSSSTASAKKVKEIELTGIDAFDDVFREARDIDNRLDGARSKLKKGKNNLNSALGLRKGTPFQDAVSDLKKRADGKLQLVMKGSTPQLQVSDAVPSNVKSAVDSLNNSLTNYKNAASDLASIKDEAKSLADAVGNFPSKLQQDYANMNISLVDLPGQLKTVKNNVRIIGNFPNRVKKLTGTLTDNISLVTTTFTGSSSSGGSKKDSSSGGSKNSGNSATLSK